MQQSQETPFPDFEPRDHKRAAGISSYPPVCTRRSHHLDGLVLHKATTASE